MPNKKELFGNDIYSLWVSFNNFVNKNDHEDPEILQKIKFIVEGLKELSSEYSIEKFESFYKKVAYEFCSNNKIISNLLQ